MLFPNAVAASALLLSSTSLASGFVGNQHFERIGKRWQPRVKREYHPRPEMLRRQFPAPASNVTTITTPTGVQIRYKNPGQYGVCETTPGVNSYSGYIDLSPTVHVFFYFFESRSNPSTDPLSLWLNGGPGSDSLIGLFDENGPCRVTENLTTVLNPYSWNDNSNMLYLSQPVGTGFSYQGMGNGSVTESYDGSFTNSSLGPPTGTWPTLIPSNEGEIDTTQLAAIAAWHVMQGFLSGAEQLNATIGESRDFNLFTESYGGHYGPAFFYYFNQQNEMIQNGSIQGYPLNFKSLGIGNGIISEYIQAPEYPNFSMNNTYGIKAYNDTVYNYANFALNMPNGCLGQIEDCIIAANTSVAGGLVGLADGYVLTQEALTDPSVATTCTEAANMCRDNVEGLYYEFSGRGAYDIRHPYNDPTTPNLFQAYLNQASVQDALGVSLNYTDGNTAITLAFQATGDFVYPNFLADLEAILDSGVRVSLYYGDADYICNWFGGQAVSLALNYTNAAEFAKQGYAPLMYGGTQYGEVREYGNFSFARVYESGHEVPYYQPQAGLAIFQRTIQGLDIATGKKNVTASLGSNGPITATHTESAPTLFPSTGSAWSTWSTGLLASYESLDNKPLPTSNSPSAATTTTAASATTTTASARRLRV